jgi:tRNA-dihydrouridine synthase 2
MIRATTAPLRLLALDHGADLVWGEEIHADKIASCQRIQNPRLGTIDFVAKNGAVIFQVCKEERGRVIFQIGAANEEQALRGAQVKLIKHHHGYTGRAQMYICAQEM